MHDTEGLVGELYAGSLPRLGAYAYALTGSYSAAEELVQDAMVKVFSRRRRLEGVAAAEAYVRATMRTIHLDALRRRKRWEAAVPRLAAADTSPDHAAGAEVRDQVSWAVAQLPSRVRTAVVLHYLDDLSVREVASSMRISDGTVKGYLKEGRERLAQVLGAELPVGDVVDVKEVRR